MITRLAVPEDADAIATIYNEGIADRVATFETRLRSPADARRRLDATLPCVVVEQEGRVVGFAWTGPTSPRECYRRNLEFSVYVARDARGRGAGAMAMRALVTAARDAGAWKLVSGVFPENDRSLRMLRAMGFREVGRHESHGQLDGVWHDVVLVELLLQTKGRPLLVRDATPADADALLGMMAEFNALEEITFDPERTRPALVRLLGDVRLGRVLLAEMAGRAAGYAVITWGYDLEFDGRDAFLTEVFLAGDVRGRKHGKTLMAAVERAARAGGAHAVHLMVRPENTPARRLYERVGFAPPPRVLLSKRLD
jgi:phosphinothricin acetyltransferase